MAQGDKKLKVKTKGSFKPDLKKTAKNGADSRRNKAGGAKKGKFDFAAKKQHHVQVFKYKEGVKKLIGANIEKELKEKAQNFEAKPFLALNKEAGAASSSKLASLKQKN